MKSREKTIFVHYSFRYIMIYLPWSISLSIINGRPFPLHFPMFSRQAGARLEGRHGTEAGQVGRPAATRLGWWKHPYRMMEIGGNWRRFWTQRSDKIWDIIKYITYIIYTYIYIQRSMCVWWHWDIPWLPFLVYLVEQYGEICRNIEYMG